MKIAYLTIDDAPSKNMREKVDYLLSRNIPAVWFCVGNHIENIPEPVIYAIKKGFIIGNHAYSHTTFSDLTLTQCFEEIQKTDGIINDIYKRAGAKRPAKFFRFPYGDKGGLKYSEILEPYEGEGRIRKERIQKFLKSFGYTQPKFRKITYKYYKEAGLLDDVDWHWTYDVMEWFVFTKRYLFWIDRSKKVFEKMEENDPEKGRGLNYPDSEEIILLHDHEETTKMFRLIIDRLLSKGITFRLPPIK